MPTISHELVLLATLTLGADGGVDAVKDVFSEVEVMTLNSEPLRDCSGEEPSDVEVLRDASNGSEDHTERERDSFSLREGRHVESRWWSDERGKSSNTNASPAAKARTPSGGVGAVPGERRRRVLEKMKRRPELRE